jgi:hypothetical protein
MQGLDLVFVPHWYCAFRATLEGGVTRGAGGRARTVQATVWTMVDALAGGVLRLPGEPPLVERDLASLAPAVAVPPLVDSEAAVERARDDLRWDLRIRGRQRIAPRELELAEIRPGHVPFWVGYYTDGAPGGQVRVRALHGIERTFQGEAFTRELLRALERVA